MKKMFLSLLIVAGLSSCTKEVEVIKEVPVEDLTRIRQLESQIAQLEAHISNNDLTIAELQEDLEIANELVSELTTGLYYLDGEIDLLLEDLVRAVNVQNILTRSVLDNDPTLILGNGYELARREYEQQSNGDIISLITFRNKQNGYFIDIAYGSPADASEAVWFTVNVYNSNGEYEETFYGEASSEYGGVNSFVFAVIEASRYVENKS